MEVQSLPVRVNGGQLTPAMGVPGETIGFWRNTTGTTETFTGCKMRFYSAEFPYHTDAAHYFAALADLPWAVWLDSGGMGRFDILTAAPQRTLVLNRDSASGDPFSMLRKELAEPAAPVENVPFAGGALGYWAYDLLQPMPASAHREEDTEQLPIMAIGIYDWALVLDHRLHTARLVSHMRFPETAEGLSGITQRLKGSPAVPQANFRVHGKIISNFTPDRYSEAFAAVKEYLRAGDCYQVNLAQRFSAAATGDALPAYRALRSLNPAPYSAFLNLPQAQILCASPERFLRVQNRRVETRPIKGTRPRGSDARQDILLAEGLRDHPKDRAENLMIVDLLRNDLSKNCEPGSVRVPKLFEVESFANVHHLVSTVEGILKEGSDALDALRDCFPGGSVTGAPKLRAMQIIDLLEPDRRGIYCGSIGYAGFDGNMDCNIVIRTLVYSARDAANPAGGGNSSSPDAVRPKDPHGTFGGRKGEIRFWAGGGIVADSLSATEFQETLDKASAMLELLRRFGGEYDNPAPIR